MAVIARLEIFSGRRNPEFTLSRSQETQLSERLKRLRHRSTRRIAARPEPGPAIRLMKSGGRSGQILIAGGLVEITGAPLAFRDDGFCDWLIDIFPLEPFPGLSGQQVLELIRWWGSKRKPKEHFRPPQKGPWCSPPPAVDAPIYDIYWPPTSDPFRDPSPCNNCYNWATYRATDTYAQPGFGSGQIFANHTCADLTAAAIRDGLVSVPNCTDKLGPGQGWYVALFIGALTDVNGKAEPDYHWVMQDASGCWSHKLGSSIVLKTDGDGAKITDPLTAKLAFYGFSGEMKYDKFCGYFRTTQAMTIDGKDSPTNCPSWGW